jgi:hypothetical protein
LGIRVISPLLKDSEVSPFLSIAEKARRRVREISSANSWKNLVEMPSPLGALPFGIAAMASRISFRVRSLVSSWFVSVEIHVGVLVQHASRASEVPGASASEV